MKRADWVTQMENTIDLHRNTPFEWGVSDCALMTADVVAAMTGHDYAEFLRGAYNSRSSASSAKGALPGGSLMGYLDTLFADRPLTYAERGDIVMMDFDHQEMLGICTGVKSVFKGENGVVFLKTSKCIKAWRVQ